MKIQIERATPNKASHIHRWHHGAMNAQCCQNFYWSLSIHWLIFTV